MIWCTNYQNIHIHTFCTGWIACRFSYALHHNDAKNMTSPQKTANRIFEKLSNLYLIVLIVLWITFFPFLLWSTSENWTKMKNLFIWTAKSGGIQTHKLQLIFTSNCNNTTHTLDWTRFQHYLWLQEFIQQFNSKLKTLWGCKNFL